MRPQVLDSDPRLEPPPWKRSLFRRLMPALILLFPLSAGTGAVAEGQAVEAPAVPLVELAEASSPSGYELQEVSVSPAEEPGAEEVVTATYLGAGVRNEISYTTFASARAAGKFLEGQPLDTCSVRTTATCLERVGEVVVTATSSSTCPHPTPDVHDRALTLLEFGSARARA